MHRFHRHLAALLTAGLGIATSGVHAGDTITVPSGRFQVDHALHLIVANIPASQVNAQWPGQKIALQADSMYIFMPPVATVATGQPYNLLDGAGMAYQLYFSELPLIGITTEGPIVDEPQVPGHFVLSDGGAQLTQADLGIEYRGGSSQFWPKKSFRIEFRSDTAWDEHLDVQLPGMRSDDDWNLLAAYNEPLRLRNVVCNRLWLMIHAPYYQFLEPDAVNGVRMLHADLFINGSYQGIYAVSERIDRKQLKLKAYDGNIRGELYKGNSWGATIFSEVPPYDNDDEEWSGFEYEYPSEATDWANLHEFVQFVLETPEAAFLDGYPSRFVLDNAVDYFILLNLLRASDNTGKNIYIARYDSGTPYFYVPWDLDGTFGMAWDGTVANITDDLLMNGFYERLIHDCRPGGFTDRLQQRWNELRIGIITPGNIIGMFMQEQSLLTNNGAYARESMAWPLFEFAPAQMTYLSNWLEARLVYLDNRFNAPCEPSGIEDPGQASISIYPNPASSRLVLLSGFSGKSMLRITDALGRIMLERSLTGPRNEVDISTITPGWYLATVVVANHEFTQKLVIN
ncbi:MAG: CotH kinase family protein [Bacteroidetes bacterium]|nr:CotH kinase family protein [Bacteroidota bacterium]